MAAIYPSSGGGRLPRRKTPYNPEKEMARSKVCGYLKRKIDSEELESQAYQKLGHDVDQFDVRKFGYIPYLMSAQRNEIKWLKAIYDKMCVNYE